MKTPLIKTSVDFKTSDPFLGNLYTAAEGVLKGNEQDFGGRTVLVEGGGYNAIWIETQPMGGEMYAKRNMNAAVNNSLLYIEHQLPNGRYPYRLTCTDGKVAPAYNHFQGFCFPSHALNLYYWDKKRDADYLKLLYNSLEAYDGYLWKYRDSDGDGCLEIWCPLDTGEDFANRFAGATEAHWSWPGETPPKEDPVFPIESMDMMSYSYEARRTLAHLAALLGNGKEQEWKCKAKDVQDKIKSYLWDDARGACYDRGKDNQFMPALQHNNLRCMYHGSFTQEMANRFVTEHLLNPDEFFTPMPLPSVAVNNPVFRNIRENNWSGQSEGLTYQRAIRALERYGFYSELTVFGTRLIDCVGKRNIFVQQFDPFTGEMSEPESRNTYGPTALSVLEYISRFYGLHVQFDELYWGALGRGDHTLSYTQHWDGDTFRVETSGGNTTGFINDREIFRVSNGLRVSTDWKGTVTRFINIKGVPLTANYTIGAKKGTIELKPNAVYENPGI